MSYFGTLFELMDGDVHACAAGHDTNGTPLATHELIHRTHGIAWRGYLCAEHAAQWSNRKGVTDLSRDHEAVSA